MVKVEKEEAHDTITSEMTAQQDLNQQTEQENMVSECEKLIDLPKN